MLYEVITIPALLDRVRALGMDACAITDHGNLHGALTPEDVGETRPAEGFDLIVCDASFISLTLLMPRWPSLLAPRGHIIALVIV